MKRRRRRLGQHFLTDNRLAARIVEIFDPTPSDTVLEIGAGRGALTKLLSGRAGKVYAVEVDGNLARCLMESADRESGVEVICGDILHMDWERFIPEAGKLRIIGNLPYAISKPLMRLFARYSDLYVDAVITLQEEVAERLLARPGSRTYGSMTVMVALKLAVESLLSMGPSAFSPPPGVRSQLLRLLPHSHPPVCVDDEDLFRATVQSAFAQRRKTLLNALKAGLASGLDRNDLEGAIREAGLEPGVRPEKVDVEGFARLAAELAGLVK